jgi:DNA-binding MarR family transcriptional regulator
VSARAAAAAHAEAPAFDLPQHLFFLVTQLMARRNRALAAQLKPLGLTVQKWRVIAVLDHAPGCTMGELADLTSVDRTTLTRTLDQLVEEKLVDRRAAAHDRRTMRLSLTDKGAALLRRVLPLVIEQNEQAVRGFSAAGIERFRSDLRRMFDNLDNGERP